jgi:hypothetical protein
LNEQRVIKNRRTITVLASMTTPFVIAAINPPFEPP